MSDTPFSSPYPAAPPAPPDPPAPDAEPKDQAPEDQAPDQPAPERRISVGDLVQHTYVDSYDERTEVQLVGRVVEVTDADEPVATVAWSTGGRAALSVEDLERL